MAIAPLISVQELSKSFGSEELFSGITLAISEQERICLIGPNGSGKSTLLRIIAGIEESDNGRVSPRNGLRLAYVPQEDTFAQELTIAKTLEQALVLSGHDAHDVEGRISITCGRFGFPDKDALVSSLSGGWRKRLALARGMIVEPELLLLDEPTNHLDIDGVLWLESVLATAPYALLFVSHDRYFIERLAVRVFEINRQYPRGYFNADGGYSDFLEARSAYLAGLHQTKESLENKVRREVEWLRQGVKARTTKAKYRIQAAGQLKDQLKSFRLGDNRASLDFSASNRKSRELIKVEGITKGFEGRTLFENISLIISPGDRLGIVGPNGSGKSTFVKTLLGQIKPDSGRVIKAPNLRAAFFDQGRSQLDPAITLKEALCTHGDSVVFKGRQVHVAGWAARFLFTKEQLLLPVGNLSGGEQARLLLAKLMLEESDILLFDEPTNDLDIKTLEVLEDSFAEYPGAIVLITHDRYLLDRTATIVLGLGQGRSGIFGDYLQWEASENSRKAEPSAKREFEPLPAKKGGPPTKLTFKEQHDLDNIEREILEAEELLESLERAATSEQMISNPTGLIDCYKRLSEQQTAVERLYNTWAALEQKKKEIEQRKLEKS